MVINLTAIRTRIYYSVSGQPVFFWRDWVPILSRSACVYIQYRCKKLWMEKHLLSITSLMAEKGCAGGEI